MNRLFFVVLSVLASCKAQNVGSNLEAKENMLFENSCAPVLGWERNFSLNPSVYDLQGFTEPVYFLGDIHGEIRKIQPLLQAAGLDLGTLEKPVWGGKKALFVIVGDVINKGPHSLESIKYLMKLEKVALENGGRVIVLAGNHEISFLVNPISDKTVQFRTEMANQLLSFCDTVNNPATPEGRWLRDRPAALKINGIFVSHSGFPKWNMNQIDTKYRKLFSTSGTKTGFACGDPQGEGKSQGFFTARNWWYQGHFQKGLENLQVFQILFAHDPNAFSDRGKIKGFYGDQQGRALIKLDVGVNIGDSLGELLKCQKWSQNGSCGEFKTMSLDPKTNKLNEGILEIQKSAPPQRAEDEPQKEC